MRDDRGQVRVFTVLKLETLSFAYLHGSQAPLLKRILFSKDAKILMHTRNW